MAINQGYFGNEIASHDFEKRRKEMKRILGLVFCLMLLVSCASKPTNAAIIKGKMILATTTSTQDSGLLDVLLPVFTYDTGWEVDVVAVGSGKAIEMATNGEADVLLVHARSDELKLVADNKVINRYNLMYNDFVLLGPSGLIEYNNNVGEVLQAIVAGKFGYVTRGDNSGTNKAELKMWQAINIDLSSLGKQLINTGQGMGNSLTIANEKLAYILSDRATYLTMKDIRDLVIVAEKDPSMLNRYGIMQVNPEINSLINGEAGAALVNWFISKEAQDIIANFGVVEFGQPLFVLEVAADPS